MARPKNEKRVPALDRPSPIKKVAIAPSDASVLRRKLRFRFDRLDIGGPWCLTDIGKEDHAELLQFMAQMEQLTVGEIFKGRPGKDEDVAAGSPNPAAKRRAEQIYGSDSERLARLEVNGLKRLWGLRDEEWFSITWWDPKHEVWPPKKR